MNMEDEVYVSLASVFAYLKSTADSRCIVEGEQLLNSKHVILMGESGRTASSIDVFALCLQTSALKTSPHEIKGKVFFENGVQLSDFVCSCKAGLSGTCKHIAAVLLKTTRCNILALEKLSSTDVQCYWTSKKKKVEEEYEAKPILQTDCFKDKVKIKKSLSEEQQEVCLSRLMNACRDSSLFLHMQGRAKPDDMVLESVDNTGEVPLILNHADQSTFILKLDINVLHFNLKSCCSNILDTFLSLVNRETVANCKQQSDLWHQERQFRITGSRCYSLYTYQKEDWQSKAESFFWPKKFTNKYVQHGIKYEGEALQKYRTINSKYDVKELGLVICKNYPWLAYSPDGVVLENGVPTRLVEIKCPYDGIDNDAINFVHNCKYLAISDTAVILKKNHLYYGQVQLGMAILNLKVCDLILYSVKSKSFINIKVDFDEDFAGCMLRNISSKYFTYLIHFICKKRNVIEK